MPSSSARENILKKIRHALSRPVSIPFPLSEGKQSVFLQSREDLSVQFATAFTKLNGHFAYCTGLDDMRRQLMELAAIRGWQKIFIRESWLKEGFPPLRLHDDLAGCDVSVTGCELLVARTGTLVLSSARALGRTTSVYAPVHVCVAYSTQLVPDLREALEMMRTKYPQGLPSLISFASGPSRTADIEKTLVTGVHGPKEVYCFLLDEAQP